MIFKYVFAANRFDPITWAGFYVYMAANAARVQEPVKYSVEETFGVVKLEVILGPRTAKFVHLDEHILKMGGEKIVV